MPKKPDDKVKIDKGFIEAGAAEITEDDLKKAALRSGELVEIAKKARPLRRFIEDFKLLASLLKDYIKGDYRDIQWWALSSVAFTLLYVLNPIDLIPDFIPLIGHLDDVAVMALCLLIIEKELKLYRQWKAGGPKADAPSDLPVTQLPSPPADEPEEAA